MGIARLAGVLLIVAGAAGLAYGGFTYTSDTHSAKVGPVVVKIQERQTVDVPLAAGVGAIALGDWLHSAFGTVVAVASALLVGAVLIFSSRSASFAVLALIGAWLLLARWWSLMPHQESGWARALEFAPFAIGFAAPVLLLMAAYGELRLRADQGPAGSRNPERVAG